MLDRLPTCGQLERTLSQQLQAFYRERLGQQPTKVVCQLSTQKVIIVIEDSLTSAETLLSQDGQDKLAQEVRNSLDDIIKPQIIALLESILQVNVIDLLTDATLDTGRTGIIAILENNPQVRESESNAKSNYSTTSPNSSFPRVN